MARDHNFELTILCPDKNVAKAGQLHAASWLEVNTAQKGPGRTDCVVQATFGVQESKKGGFEASVARLGRSDFIKTLVQDPDSDHLGLDVEAGIESKVATCCRCLFVPRARFLADKHSPDSFSSFADAEGNDGSSYRRRVGLYDLRGINEPWPLRNKDGNLSKPTPILPMNRSTRWFVTNLVRSGMGKRETKPVNDASLRPEVIFPILANQPSFKAPVDAFRLQVGRGISVATYLVPLDVAGVALKISTSVKVSRHPSFTTRADTPAPDPRLR